MSMNASVFTSVLLAALSVTSLRAKELSTREKAALGFSLRGVGVGTSLDAFRQSIPDAVLTKSDTDTGTASFLFDGGGGKIAEVTFFDNQSYEVVLMLSPSTISEIGGRTVLERKVVASLGAPNNCSKYGQQWLFPAIDRTVTYVIAGPNTAIIVMRPSVSKRVESLRVSTLDIGL
jgi:hypothetical protein